MHAAVEQSVGIFSFVPGYRGAIDGAGKEPMLVGFVSFLVAFALIRGDTRLARKRGWGSGSVGGVRVGVFGALATRGPPTRAQTDGIAHERPERRSNNAGRPGWDNDVDQSKCAR